MTDWDRRYMQLAEHIAAWSKDRSRKVGCVIVGPTGDVLAMGFNGFPRGLKDDDDERHVRPVKYLWTEHAERNAIYNAGRIGVSVIGARMYLPWFPCVDCARAIVQSGIVELVAFRPELDDPQWGEGFSVSLALLEEAGTIVRFVSMN
jgi:dCMP deaminase